MSIDEFTHPDVLTKGVAEGWADPETDPTKIDWTARQAAAVICLPCHSRGHTAADCRNPGTCTCAHQTITEETSDG